MANPAATIARGLLPQFGFSVSVPQRPADIARRYWNRLAKAALRETLLFHWQEHLPKHFLPTARSRYNYKPRKQSWVFHKLKNYGTGTDLVLTGASRRRILGTFPDIVIGGAAEGGKKGLEGTMTVRFAWNEKVRAQQRKKYEARKRKSYERRPTAPRPKAEVTIADMKREIRATTVEERAALALKFKELLLAKMAEQRAWQADAQVLRRFGIQLEVPGT